MRSCPILLALAALALLSGCGPIGQRADQVERDNTTWKPSSVVPAPTRDGYEVRQYRQVLLELGLDKRPEQSQGGVVNGNWLLVEHTLAAQDGVVTGYTSKVIASQAYGTGMYWPAWAK